MSAVATPGHLTRAIRFYEASIGKKVVMAVSGFILFCYLVGHLLGNLRIYTLNPDNINGYARFLHSSPVLLWGVRCLLLVSVVLHITASVQLWLLKRAARPEAYCKKDDVPASYAARTMMWSGPIIAAFVIFHILHLTTGDVLPLKEGDVYHNVVSGFQAPAVSIAYIVSMLLIGMHLYHGLWSMFQSVGISHPRYTPRLKRFAAIFAIFIAGGNISIPIAVMTGIVR